MVKDFQFGEKLVKGWRLEKVDRYLVDGHFIEEKSSVYPREGLKSQKSQKFVLFNLLNLCF